MDVIRRSQAGDPTAFAALFDEYKNLVYKTAYLLLCNPQDAEDVLQEVFLQVYRSLDTFDPSRGAFTTWLHRITINGCLNWGRRPRPPTLSMEEVTARDISAAAGQHPSPERLVEADDAARRALSRLSDKLRAVVVLRYYWGLSYAEISQIMGVPLGTVKSRLNAAFETMRRDMDSARRGAENVAAPGTWQQGEVAE